MRRSKADAEQTRTAILDAAEKVFCELGVASAPLEKVARAAGVTRGAFYWHFKDKADLLNALSERYRPPQKDVIEAAATHGHADPLGLLEMTCLEMLPLFEADQSRQRMFIIMSNHIPLEEGAVWQEEASAEIFNILLQLMTHARANGSLTADISPEEAAATLMIMMNGLLSEWLRSGKALDLTSVGARIFCRQIEMLRARSDEATENPTETDSPT